MNKKIILIIVVLFFIGLIVIANLIINNVTSKELVNNASLNTSADFESGNDTIKVNENEMQLAGNSEDDLQTNIESDNTIDKIHEKQKSENNIVQDIAEDEFKEKLKSTEKPILIDFYADWCMPCKVLSPIIENVAEENNNTVEFYKINIDENVDLANELNITAIPTLILFKDGQEADRSIGLISKEDVINFIK